MKRIHDSLQRLFQRHRLVFWYDPTKEWSETFHAYPDDVPPRDLIAKSIGTTTDTPGLPFFLTEIGYFTRTAAFSYTPRAVTEDVQAKFLLDAIFDAYDLGVVRTYLYDLIDDGPYANSGVWTSDEEQHFGLFHYPLQSPPSSSAKPVAVAIHNVMAILSDTGTPTFAAEPIPFSVMTTGAQVVHNLLLEKSGGVYELVLWVEPNIWTFDGGAELDAGTTSVSVQLQTPYSVKVYDPLLAATPQDTSTAQTLVPVSLGDHPIILELTPP